MKTFTFSDLNRQSGEILDAALAAPVVLTKRGKPKLVVMNAETFNKLSFTQAYKVEDAPEDVHKELMDAIDSILAER